MVAMALCSIINITPFEDALRPCTNIDSWPNNSSSSALWAFSAPAFGAAHRHSVAFADFMRLLKPQAATII